MTHLNAMARRKEAAMTKPVPNYREMDAGEMYQHLGDDAHRWTQAFMQITGGTVAGYDEMYAWACNMMMAALDFQHGQPVLGGDHAAWLQEREGK